MNKENKSLSEIFMDEDLLSVSNECEKIEFEKQILNTFENIVLFEPCQLMIDKFKNPRSRKKGEK